MRALAVVALLLLAGGGAIGFAASSPPAYRCSGGQVKLFDNSNGGGVQNGGKPPTFSTKGRPYCLASITTYHWNNGLGKAPGAIALQGPAGTVGPFNATGSSGQGGARNVNWTVNVPAGKSVVIDGTYACRDSDPATWSQNQLSGGRGFCVVYGVPAVKSSGGGTTSTPTTPAPAPKPSAGGKLSIVARPDTGKPPLTVTFTLSAPKVSQWRIDFGDGAFRVSTGKPPASITHTYLREGDYKPKLSVLPLPTSKSANTVTTSVSVHAQALISVVASPSSGKAPLAVTFALGTSIKNAASWAVDFGDGAARAVGTGAPPVSLSHTYRKDGSYRVTFSVKVGAYAAYSTFAQVTVGAGSAATLTLGASPASGTHPLTVTFTMTTTIPGIASWVIKFGDGLQQSGSGAPPATVTHTYTKKGTYLVFFIEAQQQQYGGVQYTVPRGGLPIVVG
jgi:PKD repeat protein